MSPLVKGVLLGFSIAAPVGPIGLLCIQRSVASGRWAGLACGLGAATADACYGTIAAFGLSSVSRYLLRIQTPLQLLGGLFLIYLGATTLRQKPAPQAAKLTSSPHRLRLFFSTFLLTLANPMTILSFGAVFAGIGLGTQLVGPAPALLVVGVFLGSGLWWCILSTSAAWLGSRFTPNRLQWINLAAGLIMLGFGLWQLWTLSTKPL